MILRDAGFEVITARTAEVALDAAAPPAPGRHPRPDPARRQRHRRCRSIPEWSRFRSWCCRRSGGGGEGARTRRRADDYVTKPFGPGRLVPPASTPRCGVPARRKSRRSGNGLEIDLAGHRVVRDGEEIHLHPEEFDLLRFSPAIRRRRLMTHMCCSVRCQDTPTRTTRTPCASRIANLRRRVRGRPAGAALHPHGSRAWATDSRLDDFLITG